ncbi:hypothetical protein MWU52_08105 [Jannaschia sp. S6380]|uniref:DMP19 family protein n=1 Tax=Jannaschia sp. S6380 TaxID=2926408 RepID=UPI001FF1B839|nr:hypothetical protein [Jannaschia sp. S6380]MCK0167505.1 hypothetical protein [Jannaschia sp. S6380]
MPDQPSPDAPAPFTLPVPREAALAAGAPGNGDRLSEAVFASVGGLLSRGAVDAGAVPPEIAMLRDLTDYTGQVCNGGHRQYGRNRGDRIPEVAPRVIAALEAMEAKSQLRLYRAFLSGQAAGLSGPASDRMDELFFAMQARRGLGNLAVPWILSWPFLEILRDAAAVEARLDAIAASDAEAERRRQVAALDATRARFAPGIYLGALCAARRLPSAEGVVRIAHGGSPVPDSDGKAADFAVELTGGPRTMRIAPDKVGFLDDTGALQVHVTPEETEAFAALIERTQIAKAAHLMITDRQGGVAIETCRIVTPVKTQQDIATQSIVAIQLIGGGASHIIVAEPKAFLLFERPNAPAVGRMSIARLQRRLSRLGL